jgi:hypothetical protein
MAHMGPANRSARSGKNPNGIDALKGADGFLNFKGAERALRIQGWAWIYLIDRNRLAAAEHTYSLRQRRHGLSGFYKHQSSFKRVRCRARAHP